MFSGRWVTLRQVYRYAVDPELFADKIEQAEAWSDESVDKSTNEPRTEIRGPMPTAFAYATD